MSKERSSSHTDFEVLRKLTVWKTLLKINKTVQLTGSNDIGFIYTIGWLNPRISIPQTLLNLAPADDLEAAIKDGWISSVYGLRSWPVGKEKGTSKFHNGIDIAGKEGTEVFSTGAGVVAKVVEDYQRATFTL